MNKGLDQALLCVACFMLNMLCDMCDMSEHCTWYIVYGILGLENITLEVLKKEKISKLNIIVRELN